MGTSPARHTAINREFAVGGQDYPTTAKLNRFNNAERVVEFPIGEQSRAAVAAAGVWLRNENAVPRAMMLMLRSFAIPKIMSHVTLSASATPSGVAAANGITRIVGPRVRTACWPHGASRWSSKLIPAGLETDRCAAAKADLSD